MKKDHIGAIVSDIPPGGHAWHHASSRPPAIFFVLFRRAVQLHRIAMAACVLALAWPACGSAAPERIAKGEIQYVIDAVPSWVTEPDVSIEEEHAARTPGATRQRLVDYQISS